MKRYVLIANIVAILAIVSGLAFQLLADRERVLADARSDVMNLRDAMSEHVRQTLAAVDLALNGIAEDVDTTELGRATTYRALDTRQDTFAPTFAFFILSQDGRLAATSRTPNPEPSDFSADRMFTAHRDDASAGLFIAPPRKGKVGYAEDKWIIAVSRRLTHPDGSFAGIVAAAVSLDYLNEFYDALRMGRDGVVGLSRDDGTVLTRSPFNEDVLGRVLTDTRLYRELLPVADRGVYRADFVTDGVDRIVAYGRVPDFPVVVYTGLSANERLAGWRQSAFVQSALGLVAILAIGSFSSFLTRRLDERQREQETRVAQLTRLTELSTALIESPDVATALRRVTEKVRELIPCHQAVTSLTEHPSMAQAIHTVSLSDKYAAWRDYDEKPDGSGIYRQICETNGRMRMTQEELESHAGWRGFGEAKDRHPPMRGWLAVPLMTEAGKNLGLIQLSDREGGEFTAEDEAMLVELAHVTSVAIQKLRMAEDLRGAVASAEQHRAEAEERAGDLTQRLLAFSRRQPLDPRAVDVNALVGELEPLLGRTLGEQYDMQFILQDGIDKAIADPGQLQNAIVNLAVNARDAMPNGGRLTVETAEVQIDTDYVERHLYAEPGRYVMIAIGDDGVGMSPEVRSRVFEPFFTTKRAGQGTGLGLSMVYGFIKQSNGHVNIYSELGEGTTVKLYLPCARGQDVVEGHADVRETVSHGSERVLVVEDDMLVREHTTAMLTSLGYYVAAVADGPSAQALLEGGSKFDLLLCDVVLGGGMNGRQVAEASQEALPDLKVLYMSGYTENVIVHHGRLDAGARLLLKPFRRAGLAKKVREALEEGD